MARETWLSRMESNLKFSHLSAMSSRVLAPLSFICPSPLMALVGIEPRDDRVSVATGGAIVMILLGR